MPYKKKYYKKKYGYQKTSFSLGRKYKKKYIKKPKYIKKTSPKYKKKSYKKKVYKNKSSYAKVKSKISKSWFYPKKVIKQGRRKQTRKLLEEAQETILSYMLFGNPTSADYSIPPPSFANSTVSTSDFSYSWDWELP